MLQTFFNLDLLKAAWPILLAGLGNTVLLSLVVVPLGLLGGLILSVLAGVRNPWVRWPLMAFSEEIFWAGITSIPKAQWEAARSTGLSFGQTLMNVVLPQALRLTIPPLTNRTIAITKGTALGTVVAVSEILGMASSAVSNSYNPSPLTLGAAAYLILFFPMVVLGRWLETKMRWKR